MIESNTLARPYAKAAFAYAQENKALDAWAQSLSELTAVVSVPEMAEVMGNPRLSCEQVAEMLNTCVKNLNAEMKNFVSTLANNRRLPLLPAILELFNEYKAEAERTINVHITSAFALDAEQEARFAKVLEKKLQRQVNIACDVDDKLIGGVIVRAGDHVIDGSVRGRLTQLTDSLMNG